MAILLRRGFANAAGAVLIGVASILVVEGGHRYQLWRDIVAIASGKGAQLPALAAPVGNEEAHIEAIALSHPRAHARE